MKSKLDLTPFKNGKTASVSQKVYDNLPVVNGYKIIVTGYRYEGIKDFGTLPLDMRPVNDGEMTFENQDTFFPKNAKFPPGSKFISGSIFGNNTSIGSGTSFDGVKALGHISFAHSCSIINSEFQGDVKFTSLTNINGNCTFKKGFSSITNTNVCNYNNVFLGITKMGRNIHCENASFYGDTSVMNNAIFDNCHVTSAIQTGQRSRFNECIFSSSAHTFGIGTSFSGQTIFEKKVSLKSVYINNGVIFTESGNKYDNCVIGSGVEITNDSSLSNCVYNQYKNKKESIRGQIGDNCQIISSTIVNTDISGNSYLSDSLVSYSKLDAPILDCISPNTLENVTFVNTLRENDSINLSACKLKGSNKTQSDLVIDASDLINIETVPKPSSGVVVNINAFKDVKIVGLLEKTSDIDGIIQFEGNCMFDNDDINDLYSLPWFSCSSTCTLLNDGAELKKSDENTNLSNDEFNNIINNAITNNIPDFISSNFYAPDSVTHNLGCFIQDGLPDVCPIVLDKELSENILVSNSMQNHADEYPPVDGYDVEQLANSYDDDCNIKLQYTDEINDVINNTNMLSKSLS